MSLPIFQKLQLADTTPIETLPAEIREYDLPKAKYLTLHQRVPI